MMTSLESLLNWGRYIYWAEIGFDSMLLAKKSASCKLDVENGESMLAHSAHWLACLYTVFEGWEDLKMSDPIIDVLIHGCREYRETLRRLRNLVFHFQEDPLDARLLAFTRRHSQGILWATALHFEFERYLWHWADRRVVALEERVELRDHMKAIIGWFPMNIMTSQARAMKMLNYEKEPVTQSDVGPFYRRRNEFREALHLALGQMEMSEVSPLIIELVRPSRHWVEVISPQSGAP